MEKENISEHIALIPDGNRRWSKIRGFQPWVGHRAGAKALEKILDKALELKIHYFTFWGGSFDNLTKRPKVEINFLTKLYTEEFNKIAKDKRTHENQVKINIFGRWKEVLPKEAQRAIQKAIKVTQDYKRYFLTFLLAYNGTDEMRDCIQRIVNLKKKNNPFKVTDSLIYENLWTKDLPSVDLVIRTGCRDDPHMSAGFMMWLTSYSQFYFTKTLFPDFSPEEFEKIIKDFSKKERRIGR